MNICSSLLSPNNCSGPYLIQNPNKKKSRITVELYSSQLIKVTDNCHTCFLCYIILPHQMLEMPENFVLDYRAKERTILNWIPSSCIMFFSIYRPMTKSLILFNHQMSAEVFVAFRFEKRRGQPCLFSFLNKMITNTLADIWCLVLSF